MAGWRIKRSTKLKCEIQGEPIGVVTNWDAELKSHEFQRCMYPCLNTRKIGHEGPFIGKWMNRLNAVLCENSGHDGYDDVDPSGNGSKRT